LGSHIINTWKELDNLIRISCKGPGVKLKIKYIFQDTECFEYAGSAMRESVQAWFLHERLGWDTERKKNCSSSSQWRL